MSNIVLQVENLYKQYRLGLTGTGSLRDDVGRLWAKMRGKEDPTLKIGEANNRETIEGEYVWALQDINFEVKQGEVLGIIGKNGAGKSTLLKILSKVTAPTKGNIKVKGRIASLLEVGTGFHPELTGRENVFLNGAILGMTKNDIKSKFDEIVAFSGIGKYIDTPVKRYSSGMYVRLAFAVAAHLEPEILIIDEVLAVGDAEFQKKCLGKMKDVAGEGRTVLFVSHNMGAVSILCTSALSLKQGKIDLVSKTDTVIKKYLTENTNAITENSFLGVEQNRRGNGAVRFSEIKITTLDNQFTQDFERGKTVKFSLKILALIPEIKEALVSIYLRAAHSGDFVTNTEEIAINFSEKKEVNCTFDVETTNIRPGIYELYFHIGSDTEPFDVVDGATNPLIIIEPTNVSKSFEKYKGYFDLAYKFELN